MKVKLVTGRSLKQGVGKELGKFSREYFENASICELDPEDMEAMGVIEGSNVEVSTPHGSAILRAVRSRQAPHKGLAFIPYGPWASMLTGSDTQSSGMPSLKGLDAELKPEARGEVKPLTKLLEELRRG
ncbi:MAG: molybdopterin dinucleotide binding domain-containing protein [Candidatus Bathyarchaeia archaeon]|nr:molybdopterin dinucleotide-binding protein [Candidatus Bathyarchaeota archaeon]